MAEIVDLDVEMSASAVKFIRRMMRFAASPDAAFRMRVEPGGCSGYAVTFDLAEAPAENEFVWMQDGLRICSDQKTCLLLKGAKVDFLDGIAQTGFAVTTSGGSGAACSPSSQMVPVSMLAAK
jgi:iron-sulfur cluster assembly accessory protein